jgi:hypothetical protein
MKYYEKTFILDSNKNYEIKIAKISPIKILSLSTQFTNSQNMKSSEEIFKFALEHTEIKILDKWLPVKEVDKEIYWPVTIEHEVLCLQEIIAIFIKEVLTEVFTKSSKST